jgi:hypothetical protein
VNLRYRIELRLPRGGAALAALAAVLVAGCFDAPKIEDRWTRIDLLGASLTQAQVVPAGTSMAIAVSADVTFRRILTGYAVAELRASSLPIDAVGVGPEAPRVPMAQDIDRILANSVTLGRMTRAVTGWDHLIQHIDFTFTGVTPATADSTSAGLFLLCYLGSGVKIERPGTTDTVIVTPFVSQTDQVLPVGLELTLAGSGGN